MNLRADEPCYMLMEGRQAGSNPPRRVQQLQVLRDGELVWYVKDMGLEVEWPTAHPAFQIVCGGIEVKQATELADSMRYDEYWAALDREMKEGLEANFQKAWDEDNYDRMMAARRISSFGPSFRKQRD